MNKLKIGWAFRDISTEKPVNIPGQFHMRISEGIIDPVTVTALVIDNGEDMVIFLSADILQIRLGLLKEIREKTAKLNSNIPVEKILMNATHTHTSPSHYSDEKLVQQNGEVSFALDINEIPHDGIEITSGSEYRDYLSTQVSEAICEAFETCTDGGIAYGYGYAVVAHSRRVVYFDDVSKRCGACNDSMAGVNGHAVMYGETNDDQFSHYEAGSDHFINLLYTFDSLGTLTGAIINVPCPSQNSEADNMLSADYWHDVRKALHKEYGNIFILSQCAAAGDLSPRILHYKQAQERRFNLKYGNTEQREICERKDIAQRIAASFSEVLDWARKDIKTTLPIKHIVKSVDLSKRMITDYEYYYAQKELSKLNEQMFSKKGTATEQLFENSILLSGRNRYKQVINCYEQQKIVPKFPTEIHVLRIGDIAFASNQFELYMDYQHRIQARSPFEQTFIVQLSGEPGNVDGGSYLSTERGVRDKGYSASMYCNLVSPKGGQELVEETVNLLKKIY